MDKSLKNFVESLDIKVEYNKKINNYVVDVYFPDHKVAIEYNILEEVISKAKDTDKVISKLMYNKTIECEKTGIQLLHILDFEYKKFEAVWKSVILHKLKLTQRHVYARKCKIVPITSKQAMAFLNEHHLQGGLVGSIRIGLALDGELVSVGVFSKSRYRSKQDNVYEILRFASKPNIIVVGGFSKILKEFKTYVNSPASLISYANRRWSIGGVYSATGFQLEHETAPCYYYSDGKRLYHRSIFQKHKLEKQLKIYNESNTEVENMYNNDWGRFWDVGTLTYIMKM